MRNSLLTLVILMASAAYADDPVVMTVGGDEVRLSEVRYHYGKNKNILEESLSPEKYLESFALFKMKVADAKAEGLDTLTALRKDVEALRHRMTETCVNDTDLLKSFVSEAIERAKEEVEASHIVMMKTAEPWANKILKTRLDSISELISDGADFEDFAVRFSQDKKVKEDHGYIGYVGAGTAMYDVEKALFSTKNGRMTGVVETPLSFHLFKVWNRRQCERNLDSVKLKADVEAGCSNIDDSRMHKIRQREISRLEEKHGGKEIPENIVSLKERVAMMGFDSVLYENLKKTSFAEEALYEIGDKKLTVSDFCSEIQRVRGINPAISLYLLPISLEDFYYRRLMATEENWRYDNDSEFRNLCDEYHDGALVFEISSRRVWNQPQELQPSLEKKWIKDLKRKYPVSIKVKNLSRLISDEKYAAK